MKDYSREYIFYYEITCNFANDMDEKTIKDTLLKGERVTLECKKAKAEVPKSIWQTYSAFANTIGGLILLGVNENLQEKDISKRFQIIGVDEPRKIVTDFWCRRSTAAALYWMWNCQVIRLWRR